MEKYKGLQVEFHILQSFPVTCLNRDDVGSPKSALIGGVPRARVSSQSWKRQVRMAMQQFGIKLAIRTKYVSELVQKELLELGADTEQAKGCGDVIGKALTKDTLHFFSETEAKALADHAAQKEFLLTDKDAKEIIKVHKQASISGFKQLDGLDIALFGRMIAQGPDLNLEAASVFAHAISTHRVSNEIDFFTALDDAKTEYDAESGASHMGTLEFNSATYYRYVALDIGQLVENLGGDKHLSTALPAFIKALYVAVPIARQKTQAGSTPWDYAKVYVRKGQRLQASFDEPVRSKGEGYLKPSIEALESFLKKKETLSGSLFGKIDEFTWGIDEQINIDDLITSVVTSTQFE
jgi:CRISPR system Cascade subunit CasC